MSYSLRASINPTSKVVALDSDGAAASRVARRQGLFSAGAVAQSSTVHSVAMGAMALTTDGSSLSSSSAATASMAGGGGGGEFFPELGMFIAPKIIAGLEDDDMGGSRAGSHVEEGAVAHGGEEFFASLFMDEADASGATLVSATAHTALGNVSALMALAHGVKTTHTSSSGVAVGGSSAERPFTALTPLLIAYGDLTAAQKEGALASLTKEQHEFLQTLNLGPSAAVSSSSAMSASFRSSSF